MIGLTGGIGMGKSTALRAFRRAHVAVFDADATVRRLQAPDGAALPAIAAAFPGTVGHNAAGQRVLDRVALRKTVFADPVALARLESMVLPLVRAKETAFLAAARRRRATMVVLDLPLLFEARGRRGIDTVVVVSAPAAVQRARVLRRGLLSPAQLDAVLARQWPDSRRRRAADLVIRTGLSRNHTLRQLRRIGLGAAKRTS